MYMQYDTMGPYLLHHPGGDCGLADGRPPATHDPVDGTRFLVGAVVAADRQHLHVGTLLPQSVQGLLRSLGGACKKRALEGEEEVADDSRYPPPPGDGGANGGDTLEIMFMPMASPVCEWKRMYRFLPAKPTKSFSRRANLPEERHKRKKNFVICNISFDLTKD